jgi:hypothetical protein
VPPCPRAKLALIACFEQSRQRVAAELALEVDALVSIGVEPT